jgi:primosomal protein N' (replication factor Y)
MPFRFADIILPVAVDGRFTYSVPDNLAQRIKPGVKALVQFGSIKLYTGIICRLHDEAPDLEVIRPLISIPDPEPVVSELQLSFWRWISGYYMCSEGEVMKAAIPSAFLPDGVTSTPVLEKYKPKEESFIELAREFSDSELTEMLDKLKRAPRQYDALIAYLHISDYKPGSGIRPVKKSLLMQEENASAGAISLLIKKEIFSVIEIETGRLKAYTTKTEPLRKLSELQLLAYNSIREYFGSKEIVLLHGVTSSGKTEIYIHLIEEQLKKGKQVLYLLPEIALTTQIVLRLQKHFGQVTGVYHSRFNDQEKVEIWKKVASESEGFRLILGVRSSVFLPFSNLGLIIVDEEHDTSFKQHDPAPRYHARDAAIMLGSLHKAKCLLGSATPSIESYFNAVNGKYALTELKERFGSINLPSIIIANTREAYRKKLMVSHFTPELLNAIDGALGKNEQVILFRNRRGFSPYIDCNECGWIPLCNQCSVNLTYHKGINRLVCHYCGYQTPLPHACGNCGSTGLVTRGFGTEKIEDEIKIIFPSARVVRMDQDSTTGRNAFNRIISAFEEHRTDILIGTQMISKGLDFENLTVVGILNADNMLNFPDFRAHERGFQLMEQVSGRAGRRRKQGKVIIQTTDPSNTVIRMVLRHDYLSLFRTQSEERKNFNYPPYCRLIRISLKHKERDPLNRLAELLGNTLKDKFGKRVLGPEYPVISQVQLWFIKNILIKIEREKPLAKAKELIREAIARVESEKGKGGLRIVVDVDPY